MQGQRVSPGPRPGGARPRLALQRRSRDQDLWWIARAYSKRRPETCGLIDKEQRMHRCCFWANAITRPGCT
jgi:hypothetical protein